jgi:hypothetical protein
MAKPSSVLDAVSQASMEIGIAQRPLAQAINSLDQDVVQLVALLSTVADEVLSEQPYEDTLGDGNWLMASDGSAFFDKPQQDTDVILFDSRLAINGLKFRFLAAKGLEYGEQLRDFAGRMNRLATDANGRVLDLDTDEGVVQ